MRLEHVLKFVFNSGEVQHNWEGYVVCHVVVWEREREDVHYDFLAMIGENRQLVTNEPVVFEK